MSQKLYKTVVDKTQQISKRPYIAPKYINEDTQYYYYQQRNQGLPNIGNTCFLNSAIQFLYSSILFRQKILELEFPFQSFERKIAKIFFCIKNECKLQQKRKILVEIIKFMWQKNLNFQKYSQQDCFQFIFFILENIGENYPNLLSFFKLYYKFVCSHCRNTIKRKDYIIFNKKIICEQCQLLMEIQLISVPQCIILRDTALNENELKIKTVEEKQVNYQMKAKVIYSGNGKYGHCKVSRRKSDDQKDDRFYTFSDSYIFEDRSSSNYGRYYQKVLLYLYEIDKISENVPIQSAQINSYSSKICTDSTQNKLQPKYSQISILQQRQAFLKQKISPKKFTDVAYSQSNKKQQKCDFRFLIDNIGIKPLQQLLSAFAKIKSLNDNINQQRKPTKIVQSIKTIILNLSSNKYPKNTQRIGWELNFLYRQLKYYCNEESLRQFQEIFEKLSSSKCFTSKNQQLKLVLFIAFSNLLALELPSIRNSFKFSFKYYCKYCGKTSLNVKGFFLTTDTQICCSKPMNFNSFYFQKKPIYLIFIKNKSDEQRQQVYEFNCINNAYPIEYNRKSQIIINQKLNFQIYEETFYRVQISPPNSLKKFEYSCKNITIKLLFKLLNLDLKEYLSLTKDNVKINKVQYKINIQQLQQMQLEQIKLKQQNISNPYQFNYNYFILIINVVQIN